MLSPAASARADGIRIAVDGVPRPAGPGAPVLSSAAVRWSGFLVEAHDLPSCGHARRLSVERNLVVLWRRGGARARVRLAGAGHVFSAGEGTGFVLAAGSELEAVVWRGAHQAVFVELGSVRLSAHEIACDPTATPLGVHLAVADPRIAALVGSMCAEIEAGCPSGPLYAECVSLALAAYVSSRYGLREAAAARRPKPELSPHQLQRVRDYIDANLSGDLALHVLAGLLRLSANHFARLFKNTTGMAPHQYVIRRRVEQGRALLGGGRMSIAEVALTLGFASQSHFTDAFKRITGTTPGRERHPR